MTINLQIDCIPNVQIDWIPELFKSIEGLLIESQINWKINRLSSTRLNSFLFFLVGRLTKGREQELYYKELVIYNEKQQHFVELKAWYSVC